MKRQPASALATLVAVAAVGGCSQTSEAPDGGAAAQSPPAAVSMVDVAFQPADLQVGAGDTVVWLNDDDAAHTVAFADEALGASDLLNPGDQYSVTFEQAGTFDYVCTVHPDMTGAVTVTG